MKTPRSFISCVCGIPLVALVLAAVLLLRPTTSVAATNWFDPVPGTAALEGGTGNWADADWKLNSNDTTGVSWANSNDAWIQPNAPLTNNLGGGSYTVGTLFANSALGMIVLTNGSLTLNGIITSPGNSNIILNLVSTYLGAGGISNSNTGSSKTIFLGSNVTLTANQQWIMQSGTGGGATFSAGKIDLRGVTLSLVNPLGSSQTFNGNLTGGGNLIVTNSGSAASIVLTGTNTYTGPTLVQGAVTLGSGTLSIQQFTGVISNQGVILLSANGGTANIIGSQIVGTGVVNQSYSTGSGSGTYYLTNANTYSGGTLVGSPGTLWASNASALGTGPVLMSNSAATINFAGFTHTLGSVTLLSGALTNGSFSSPGVEIASGTISANIAGTGLVLKSGTGGAILSGSNSYSGPTVVAGGIISNTSAASSLPFGSGSLVISNLSMARLSPTGSGGPLSFLGGTNPGSTFTYAGGVTLGLRTGSYTQVSYTFGDGNMASPILVRSGRGTLVLLDSAGSAGALGAAERIIVNGLAPTNINGMVSPNIALLHQNSLAGSPEFVVYDPVNGFKAATMERSTLAGSTSTNKVGLPNSSTTTVGDGQTVSAYAIQFGGSGAATVTLSNNATLAVGDNTAGGFGGISIGGGSSILAAAGTTNQALNFGASEGVFVLGSGTGLIGVPIRGTGGLTKYGYTPGIQSAGAGGILVLMSATSTVSGPLTVNGGSLILSNGAAMTGISTVNLLDTLNIQSGGALNASSNIYVGPQGSLTLAGTLTSGGQLLNASPTAGTISLNGGTLVVDSLVSTNAQPLLNSGTLTVSNGLRIAANADYNLGGQANSAFTLNVLGGASNSISSTSGGLHGGNAAGMTVALSFLGGTSYNNAVNTALIIGEGVGSTGRLTVAGAGTVFSTPGRIQLGGAAGALSYVTISNGGALYFTATGNSSPLTIGSAANNRDSVLLVDNGTLNTLGHPVIFGVGATNMTFMVTNGGRASVGGVLLSTGNSVGGINASSNLVAVIGSGSVLTNLGGTTIGANTNSTYNRLLVLAGGSYVHTGTGGLSLGGSTNAYNNTALVAGSGSLLSAPLITLGVGAPNSTNNTLWVTNGATLALGSGGLSVGVGSGSVYFDNATLRATANSAFWISNSVPVFLRAGGLTLDDSGSNVTIAAVLAPDPTSNGGGLTKVGSGSVILNANNTYTGGTVISNGALIAGASAVTPFNTGVVRILSGAVLGASNANPDALLGLVDPTSTGTFALAASTASNLNFNSRSLSNLFLGAWGGSYTNSGVFTPYGTTYRLGGGGGTLTFSNQITGGSSVVIGTLGSLTTGTVALNTSNSFTGGVTLNSGTLRLDNVDGMGRSVLTNNGGSLYLNTPASSVITNGIVLNADLGFVGSANSRAYFGSIGGSGRLFITNSGNSWALSLTNNTYSGGTFLSNITIYAYSNALGTGPVVVYSGASIQPQSTIVRNDLYFSNVTSHSSQGSGAFAGRVDMGGATNFTFFFNSNSELPYSGNLTNAGTVAFSPGTQVSTAAFSLGNSNFWTGDTLLNMFTLTLTNQGMLVNSTNVVARPNTTFSLENRGVAVSRLPANAVVALSNATFQMIGPGTVGQISTQQVGAISLTYGQNTVVVTNRATIAANNLLRANGATVNFTGTNGLIMVLATAPDGTTGGLVPWATVNGTDFAGYDSGVISAYSAYLFNTSNTTVTNAPSGNWKLTNSVATTFAISGPSSVNSLVVASNNVTLNFSNSTLSVGSGALLLPGSGATLLTNGTVGFGTVQGVINSAGVVSNAATLAGSAGFAKSGSGTLILLSTNTYTGDTFVNQGTLQVNAGASISNQNLLVVAARATNVLNGGSMVLGGISAASVAQGAITNNGVLLFNSGTLLTTSNSTLQPAVGLGITGPMAWTMVGGSNSLGGTLTVGATGAGSNSRMVVSNGAFLASTSVVVSVAGGSFNTILVSDSSTVWTNTGALTFAPQSNGSLGGMLMVSNGASFFINGLTMNNSTGPFDSNAVIVTGSNSLLYDSGAQTKLGNAKGTNNAIMVLNGARLVSQATEIRMGEGNLAYGNQILVDGQGSLLMITNLSTAALNVGFGGSGLMQQVLVTNKGSVFSGDVMVSGSFSNLVLVSDPGSVWSNRGSFYVGRHTGASANMLMVSNGAVVTGVSLALSSGTGVAGTQSNINNSAAIVTGTGSVLALSGTAQVGSDPTSKQGYSNSGSIFVVGGGTLEASGLSIYSNVLTLGMSGYITNNAGIYQFTTASPTIIVQTNAPGFISLVDGTISFRNSSNVNVKANWGVGASGLGLTNLLFGGNNTLRLNNSYTTNSGQDYVFDTGRGATNYARLEMINGTNLWQGGSLTIGANGTMLASNTLAIIQANATNEGNITVVNALATWAGSVVLNGGVFLTQNATNQFNGGLSLATGQALTFTTGTSRVEGSITNAPGTTINAVNANVTFGGPVVISGLYNSDPSTNTFVTNVTVTSSGALQGSNGDLFVFQKDLLMQSTNSGQFSLSQATVLFSNGPSHLLSVSNSGALNLGQGFSSFSQVASNFALGTLSIAAGDKLTIAGNKDSLTNALYVGWLDIQGLTPGDTNSYLAVSNVLVAALSLPNINLYYDVYDVRNDWLTRWLPPVNGAGYDLWGGGLLLPIPEPSSTALLLLGALAVAGAARLRRKPSEG